MRSSIPRTWSLIMLLAVAVFLVPYVACLPTTGRQASQGLVISKVEVEHPNIYPRGYTDITCTAISTDGGELRYKWSSSGGTLIGEGSKVRWEAPNTYGDFNIMVVVEDAAGRSAQETVKVTVIVKPEEACCGRAR